MQDKLYENHRSPAVKQLISDLAQQIRSGELRPGDSLPTIRELAARYGIGYVSAVRALRTLNDEGFVESKRGRGAIVCAPPVHKERVESRQAVQQTIRDITLVFPTQECMSQQSNPDGEWAFRMLIASMSAAMAPHGIHLRVMFADTASAHWRTLLDSLDEHAGVLFILHVLPSWAMRLERLHIPYALVLPAVMSEFEEEIPCVGADLYQSVREAVGRLVRAGRKRAVYIGDIENEYDYPRYRAFIDEVTSQGGEIRAELPCTSISRAGGRDTMRAYLAQHPDADFDLLFAGNDLRSLGAMDVLKEAGIAIPQQVAVLGFDDIPQAAEAGLSTVRLPIAELGERCISWFLNDVVGRRGVDVPRCLLSCPTIWRQSTDVFAVNAEDA